MDAAGFRSRVDRSPGFGPAGECWRWTGGVHGAGYGVVRWRGAVTTAQRVAVELDGRSPAGAHVIHSCDTRLCVNPSHLAVATNAANIADKVAKGRQGRGEGVRTARLTDAAMREIRASGLTHEALAEAYGVSRSLVGLVRQRRRWRHVT